LWNIASRLLLNSCEVNRYPFEGGAINVLVSARGANMTSTKLTVHHQIGPGPEKDVTHFNRCASDEGLESKSGHP
jgi:hypothetical protein